MASEKRLIDAVDFDLRVSKHTMSEVFPNWKELPKNVQDAVCKHGQFLRMLLETQPTVDAVEVVHGRWEDVKETSLYVPDMKYTVTHTAETCSVCKVRIGFIGSKLYLLDNICPNCGAKMDGERKMVNLEEIVDLDAQAKANNEAMRKVIDFITGERTDNNG